MTLQEAKELRQQLQSTNPVGAVLQRSTPFVRIPAELARKAEQANRILLKETQKEMVSKESEALF